MRKLIKSIAVLTLSAISLLSASVFAENNEISVLVNNESVTFDQPPVIMDGRTLVPIRAVFEKVGADVSWDDVSKTATITKNNYVVCVGLGNPFITKNNTPIPIDVASTIVNDRILIPVRAISEAMDLGVTWNPAFRSVLISTDGKEYRANAQWNTGFKTLKDSGFFIKSSVSGLKYDLNSDNTDDVISFTLNEDGTASLIINNVDYTSVINEVCSSPYALGIVDVKASDKFKELIIVDGGQIGSTAFFFRYNGYDLFELQSKENNFKGIKYNENLFFDNVENIISDLEGLCFTSPMVCTGVYSLEDDTIMRYSLNHTSSFDSTITNTFNDDMAFFVDYTDAYIANTHIGNASENQDIIHASDFTHEFTILDAFRLDSDPSVFELFIRFSDGRTAVIWPYSV